MTQEVVVWVVLLAAMATLFVLVVRRMAALAARTRDLERFQRAVESIDRRFAGVVAPLVRSLDETRRHTGNPDTLRQQATEAETVLTELASEARDLAAPRPLAATAALLAGEVERAIRATSLVDHGIGAMVGTSMGRDLEAQTALKRGALNLVHAQEAYARRAREVARLRPPNLVPGATLPAALTATPASTWSADDEEI
jgi:hypothetical protein